MNTQTKLKVRTTIGKILFIFCTAYIFYIAQKLWPHIGEPVEERRKLFPIFSWSLSMTGVLVGFFMAFPPKKRLEKKEFPSIRIK